MTKKSYRITIQEEINLLSRIVHRLSERALLDFHKLSSKEDRKNGFPFHLEKLYYFTIAFDASFG